MAGKLRVPRSRGAFSGVLLVLLGIWGGLVPLVGPYVHYAFTPDRTWTMTTGRVWLEILPAAGTILGGIIVLASRLRPAALFGASLAAVSGGWFAFGSALAPLWTHGPTAQGVPVGGQIARAVEQIGFFTGLGAVIVCIASVVLGRLSVVSVRDARTAQHAAGRVSQATVADQPAGDQPAGAVPTAVGAPAAAGRHTAVSEPTTADRTILGRPAASARTTTGTAGAATMQADSEDDSADDGVDTDVAGTRESVGSGPSTT